MQGSSGDASTFSFGGNAAAPAEGEMQSFPGTGTGDSEARSGLSQWNTPGMSRRRRTSDRSSASRSGSQRHRGRGDRSARHRDRDDRRPRQRTSTRSDPPIRTGPRGLGLKGMGREEYRMPVMREVLIEVMKV